MRTRRSPVTYPLVVRLAMVVIGLALNGVGVAALIQSDLGLGAWDVLHGGIAKHTGLSFGVVVILVTVAALIPWWPLHERPHVGTILNIFVAGIVIDWVLSFTRPQHSMWMRIVFMVGGILVFAIGQGMYLAPGLGAGAREGLMTGLHRRFGISIRLARFAIEFSVLVLGIALGGEIGVGTVLFTLFIGPLVQWSMHVFGYQTPSVVTLDTSDELHPTSCPAHGGDSPPDPTMPRES